jgi:hypothetical protein
MLYVLSAVVGAAIMLFGVAFGTLISRDDKITITAKKEANR